MPMVRTQIEALIRGEHSTVNPCLRLAASAAERCYEAGVRIRLHAYRSGRLHRHRLSCPVISVGNLTVGGTGKTPFSQFLAERLSQAGYRIAVISRGYLGRSERIGGIVSDGSRLLMGPRQAGDEPFLLALKLLKWRVPVLVGGDRVAVGQFAVQRFKPDAVLLDDGFQHLRLMRDVDLVLMDAARPIGNGRLLPNGPLREPVESLSRCSAIVATRCTPESVAGREKGGDMAVFDQKMTAGKPLFLSSFRPVFYRRSRLAHQEGAGSPGLEPMCGTELRGKQVFLFSGIARNREFRLSVERQGCCICGGWEFRDHHAYSRQDLLRIGEKASQTGAEMLLTTEKDWVKVSPDHHFPLPLCVVGIETHMGPYWDRLREHLDERIDAF
ncbi:MAG: tetraacyldisaccharide 4'-kinase [Desulfobacterales bacterium]